MSEMLITITQALQLVALAPSVFVIAFLICASKRDGENLVPIFYFVCLSAYFMMPLLALITAEDEMSNYEAILLGIANLTPAFSFLLIVQFLRGARPPYYYWLVLALPIIGGTPFIYASLNATEVCLDDKYCVITDDLRILYNIASGCLIFLLVVFYFARGNARIAINDTDREHKYWLVIALILLNLVILGVDLLTLADNLRPQDAVLISTVIRIGFIYLVLTSIFRLFYDVFAIEINTESGEKIQIRDPEADRESAEEITRLMEEEHIYREMGLTRDTLAKRLHLSEHQVSRIINSYFRKNFNELINEYRVHEAKLRLKNESTQITTIAFEVGFNSIASFNRVFKELTDTSPSAYRNFNKNIVRT